MLPLEQRHKDYLEKQAQGGKAECVFTYRSYESVTPEDVRNADVLLGNVSPAIIRKAREEGADLKWVQLNSAGADAYAPADVLGADTILTCSSGAYGVSVAEHMLAMTMALIRRFGQYGRQQVNHEWKVAGSVTSIEESTVLVLGLGDIGGRYARMCHALGASVIGVRRTLHGEKPEYLAGRRYDTAHPG